MQSGPRTAHTDNSVFSMQSTPMQPFTSESALQILRISRSKAYFLHIIVTCSAYSQFKLCWFLICVADITEIDSTNPTRDNFCNFSQDTGKPLCNSIAALAVKRTQISGSAFVQLQFLLRVNSISLFCTPAHILATSMRHWWLLRCNLS